MARKKEGDGLTPLELELMKILWEIGPATVQQVQARLPEERALAYTTVQTMLNLLDRKGKARRELRDRAYVYAPLVTRHQAVRQAVGDVVDRLFGGSPERLVMSLVETEQLTPERLQRLAEMLDEGKEPEGAPRAARGANDETPDAPKGLRGPKGVRAARKGTPAAPKEGKRRGRS